jgi:uncharacterized protein (DUF305 family)
MNNKILFGIGGIVVGFIIASLFSPIAPFRSMMGIGNYSNSPVLDRTTNVSTFGKNVGMMNNIDQRFIEQMIPHHEGAIAMSNLASSKATHPEIKTLAKSIIESQSKEIKDMQGWYKGWFGQDIKTQNTYSYGMMGGGMMSGNGMHMGGQEDIQLLTKASDFDKAFIEGMIPHHQLAIMMAQMLKAGTNRPEMLTLANNIIESQSKEITEMQGWYKAWYK